MTLFVFDLVSTLIDSGPRYIEAYIRVSNHYGQTEVPSRARLSEMLGEKNLKQIVAECSPGIGTEKLAGFMQDCNAMCDALLSTDDWNETLYPDAVPTLSNLKNRGHELGIFTGTRADAMSAQIYHHGLMKYFNPCLMQGKDNQRDAMLDSTSLKKKQLREIKALYGDDDIIAVGDSLSDYFAARALNIRFVGIERDCRTADKLRLAGATVFKDLHGLTEISVSRFQAGVSPEARSIP